MVLTEILAEGLVSELLKRLAKICKKMIWSKAAAKIFIQDVENMLPIFQEIQTSGVELPQARQQQLQHVIETLKSGKEVADKLLSSSRLDLYKSVRYTRKMEKMQKVISRFMTGTMEVHKLADFHQVRLRVDLLDQKVERLNTGVSNCGRIEEAIMKMRIEEQMNIVGTGMVFAKYIVKEMILGRDDLKIIGISGIAGSGKTTLATQIYRDPQVHGHYNNRVVFVTVSQTPNFEQLRQSIWSRIACETTRNTHSFTAPWEPQIIGRKTLIILDDIWSLLAVKQLVFDIPGCKTLVVSGFKFPTVCDCTYEVELLRDDEARSLFCYSAFGQGSIPPSGDRSIVEQVVMECKRLPLALKVVGASLRGQPQMFWASAKSRLSRAECIHESHETELLERMEISISYLPAKFKECFLDLASFPEDKKIPLDVLINMWVEMHDLNEEDAYSILRELSETNLITLVQDVRAQGTCSNYFEITVTLHDILRDMALRQCNRVCVNDRMRLFMPRREDRLPKEWERHIEKPFQAQIVSIHTGEMKERDWFAMDFPKAEVLILNFSSSEYYLPPFIKRMPKLRALVVINNGNSNALLHNMSVFSTFSNLKSLWLEKVIVPSAHSISVPLSNLHKISLVLCDFSNNLNGSIFDIPLILPRLSDLTIDHCINLPELPSKMCNITCLARLSITNCHDLQHLPTDVGELNSLLILRLCSCPNLAILPGSIGGLDRLEFLDISQCLSLRSLPDRMGEMKRLEKIDMRECSQIRSLPASVLTMRQLRFVVCDQEASWLWREVERVRQGLHVEVAQECFNLDWLSE